MRGLAPGWADLATAIALVLVIEGALYALFPGGMKRMAASVQPVPEEWLRRVGVLAACLGVLAVWLIRR
jgi:uncharacterized protein YjeT (DUF2065 family)